MKKSDLQELHYIAKIDNLKSLNEIGLLCHEKAAKVKHESFAMSEIQEKRAKKAVPGGLRLHNYVNLYINARNKALFNLKCTLGTSYKELCILRISVDVLEHDNTIIADKNAASNYVLFAPAPEGLENIEKHRVFAIRWTHSTNIDTWAHGSETCAEVLVPYRIDKEHILGVYVSCNDSKKLCEKLNLTLNIFVNEYIFFLG